MAREGSPKYYRSREWTDKYGRSLGDIVIAGESLVEYLLENRLGVEYLDGGSRALLKDEHEANFRYLIESGRLSEL